MHPATLSIKVFAVYAILTGLTLLLVPNLLLSLVGMPLASEVWIRVLGALAAVLGYYYWTSAASEATAFYRASVPGRFAFAALCIGIVLFAGAPWQLSLFAIVEILSALWTAAALRKPAAAGRQSAAA